LTSISASLDSVGEKSKEVFVSHRLFVEFSDNVVVKLVGNSTVRKHGPVNRHELFAEFGFQRLRSDFVLYFYSNPAIWPLFGHEGPSNDKGGYLHRGFNDIDWIKKEEV